MQCLKLPAIRSYEQLGLKFKLYSAEILFNMALCMLNMVS